MPCFPDNLQWSYYCCRHLAPFSHTTFCSFSVHCIYNVAIFPCTVISPFRIIRFLNSYTLEAFDQFWVVYYKAKAIEAGSNECQLCWNSNTDPGQCCRHRRYLILFNDCQYYCMDLVLMAIHGCMVLPSVCLYCFIPTAPLESENGLLVPELQSVENWQFCQNSQE